ncbi:MAG: hypothetical protein R2829_11805 [Bacteroidia bacterium]
MYQCTITSNNQRVNKKLVVVRRVDKYFFKMQSPSFKPDYAGQNPHGSKSQCGVMLNDWIGTIGGGTQYYQLNYFNNLNTGIVGIGSMLTVKRSCFLKI